MTFTRAEPPRVRPVHSPLDAMGRVVTVMIRATQLHAHPFLAPPDEHCVEDAKREPRPCLRPMLTADAHTEASELGVGLRPDAMVADIDEILGALIRPPTEDGFQTIEMTRLTLEMIRASFAAMLTPPPVLLDVVQAAEIMRIAPGTLTRLVSTGRIHKSVKRGKPLVFYRDLLVQEWMCP